MTGVKGNKLAIEGEGIASIQERLKQLFKGRSLRQASIDWGLPYSTLNNYFSKGATPGLDVVIRIAQLEGVPISWLASGRNDVIDFGEVNLGTSDSKIGHTIAERMPEYGNSLQVALTGTPVCSDAALATTWETIFQSLSLSERSALVSSFVKIGAKGILQALNQVNDADSSWMSLSHEEKERLIRLNEQLKKGTSETDSGVGQQDLASTDKKAG
ncbi:helix-turn-helix domain-containing protein [Phytobacter sp. V91]|uniref:helix-turn-helix domain-containing protein n=1 Tax=Phytobacter sp. V91 TaxID=3369425 RepID=UPI003F5EAB78